ncbi:L-aspartate oxidase [Acidiphilium sp. PA]|uniref:L-aspartate oxidase n=1 Tax=Acidiphilium sp. PA TaxID=2871705 RepID=UPI002243D342|nr:L-aspartate oxidase [Acidiphilium sp. PA]MCW8308294.1 L-aspartate oxidase [Acidiphilium sp. PA]
MKHIIGAGIAGLAAALAMAPEPVTLITAGTFEHGAASLWSQGGIAAAIGVDDSPALHCADTIAAGDGLCDPDAVRRIIEQGPAVIEALRRLGVAFDEGLGLEAAHTRRRIVHVRDRTGLAITQALAAAVRGSPHIRVLERTAVRDLHAPNGVVAGLWIDHGETPTYLPSNAVLIATGGIGALYRHSSNPAGATGSGLAVAARAGAVLRDLEFVQFHPTGLGTGSTPMPLISEAVRGEGARLIDETDARFTDELAPRDAVSRAVFHHLGGNHRVFLDATGIAGFATRFPTIDAACKAAGIDPAVQPIPVRPVAHYHMGGIAVDAAGRTTIGRLFAAGEAACTGLHGANRLASNSLLEAFVTGQDAGRAMAMVAAAPDHIWPPAPEPRSDASPLVSDLVSRHLGVLRDHAGLARMIGRLLPLAAGSDAALIALMTAVCAIDRTESRGAHCRTDHATPSAQAVHTSITMRQALSRAAALIDAHRQVGRAA